MEQYGERNIYSHLIPCFNEMYDFSFALFYKGSLEKAQMQNHSIEFYCIMSPRLLTQQLFNQIWPYSCSDALEL